MIRIKLKDYINALNNNKKNFNLEKNANKRCAGLIMFESCAHHEVFKLPPKMGEN